MGCPNPSSSVTATPSTGRPSGPTTVPWIVPCSSCDAVPTDENQQSTRSRQSVEVIGQQLRDVRRTSEFYPGERLTAFLDAANRQRCWRAVIRLAIGARRGFVFRGGCAGRWRRLP